MNATFDAIVVGARCAGSPTAMLLARRGHRVLLVDRARFPSDTISTHVVQPRAVSALARWGLLERLAATGCPPVRTYRYDFGRFALSGAPGTPASPIAYCPRRTVLDKLLLDAAVDAGAEVRERFTVEGLVWDDGRVVGIRGREGGGGAVTERAAVVVGADGRSSVVASWVRAERYRERPPLLVAYYAYWSDLPMEGRFETVIRPRCGAAAAPTHDGLTVVIAGLPAAEFDAFRRDIEGQSLRILALAPDLVDRVRRARRETRFAGASVPNFFRKPYGAGWVLVGDAGYNKDPITAQGILDAFRDAEACATALDATFRGVRSFDEAMDEYHRSRDQDVGAMYDFTCQLATLEPPAPELEQLFRGIAGNQPAMDRFAQMNAGTLSPAAFFAPESLRAMTAGTEAHSIAG